MREDKISFYSCSRGCQASGVCPNSILANEPTFSSSPTYLGKREEAFFALRTLCVICVSFMGKGTTGNTMCISIRPKYDRPFWAFVSFAYALGQLGQLVGAVNKRRRFSSLKSKVLLMTKSEHSYCSVTFLL